MAKKATRKFKKLASLKSFGNKSFKEIDEDG